MRKIKFIIFFLIVIMLLCSCSNSLNIKQMIKDPKANYGFHICKDKDDIYINTSSGLFKINQVKDTLVDMKTENVPTVFSVNNKKIYYEANSKLISIGSLHFCVYEKDFYSNNVRIIAQYDEGKASFEHTVFSNGNINYIVSLSDYDIAALPKHETPKIPTGSAVIKPDDESFILYKNNNLVFSYENEYTCRGIYDIANKTFMPYNADLNVLDYDSRNRNGYVLAGKKLYRIQAQNAKLISDLKMDNNWSPQLGGFAEDNRFIYLYLHFQEAPDVCFRINKENGNYNRVYSAKTGERILYLASNYYILYRKGYIEKYTWNSKLVSSYELYGKAPSTNDYPFFEQGGNYLYTEQDKNYSIFDTGRWRKIV